MKKRNGDAVYSIRVRGRFFAIYFWQCSKKWL